MDEVKQNHELAEHDYMFGMKYKDIAAKYDVTINTVKSWKTRYGWSKDKEKGVHTKPKKVCTQNKRGAQKEEVAAKEVEQVIENPNLTDKQQLFCLYYVKYRNKTKAYQKAYECSLANAQAHSYELWKKVEVRKEVNRLLAEYRADIELDIKDLFQWYLDIARADVNDFIVITSKGLKMRNGTEIDGVLISEVKEGQYGISVKLQEKHKALSWLGEHIGLATEEQKARIAMVKAQTEKINAEQDKDKDKNIEIVFKKAGDSRGRKPSE